MVAGEKYGSGNLERKYRFSTENGNLERIGRKRETVATSVKQFFKVTFYGMHQCSLCTNFPNFPLKGDSPPRPHPFSSDFESTHSPNKLNPSLSRLLGGVHMLPKEPSC